jgi:hypothetical protein
MFGFTELSTCSDDTNMLGCYDGVASRTAIDLVHPDRGELVLARVRGALGDPVRLGVVARLAEAEHRSSHELEGGEPAEGVAGVLGEPGRDAGDAVRPASASAIAEG